ncbi:MAG: NAD(P)-dependent oxidoreductase [Erysipelotrichaceae bacterium]
MLIAVVNSNREMQEVYFDLSKTYDTYLINEFSDFDKIVIPDVLILPIKGMNDKGYIKGKQGMIQLDEAFYQQLNDTMIFAGVHHPFLKQLSYPIHYYLEDKEVIERNAVFTSEGVLFLLIDNSQLSLLEQKIDIIGYGACGKAIYDLLKALKVQVRVIRRIVEEGQEDMVSIQQWRNMECGDVIINTAPAPIINRELMLHFSKKPLIIDIASGNQIDEKMALLYGIRLIKAESLPAMFTSVSAGRLIGEYIRGKIDAEA